MNKTKRIAFVAVSTVMAATIALSVTACGGGNDSSNKGNSGSTKLAVSVDSNGKLSYSEGINLRMNVGNQNDATPQSISYGATIELKGSTVMPDGVTYNSKSLKPAWAALGKQLKVNFTDSFQNRSGDKQITTAIAQNEMASYDIITASGSAMTQNASSLVNLNDYLEYMPNYKAFLDANPVVKYSLTSSTTTGAMYYAPYFDGNDDIEKYELAEQSWIRKILDSADVSSATVTFKAQADAKSATGDAHSAESYMGTTGVWTVETTMPAESYASDGSDKTFYVAVNYGKALEAAQSASTGLGAALKAADANINLSDLKSGNIVDLENVVIDDTKGEVTGAQLTTILQEYIKVAYYYGDTAEAAKTSTNALYGATVNGVETKLSDVFNSEYAAWDVDLLVALSRSAVTAGSLIGADTEAKVKTVYGISARQGTTQRRVDLSALAGELYGVRGMESRYEYSYIDANGNIHDARGDEESYNLLANFSTLTKEGLVYTGTEKVDVERNFSKCSALLIHDYAQTQTQNGFSTTDTSSFDVSPINTPVSKWDVDGDGEHTDIMRFTESWRSVKNTGFCISKAAVQNDSEKLAACLAFIDYLFSNDGQILMTYGPQSTNNTDTVDGWWYASEVTDKTVEAVGTKIADETNYYPAQYEVKSEYKAQYFIYNGKVYTGTAYNGTQVPTMTTLSQDFFQGKTITVGETTITQNKDKIAVSAAKDYTNYARKIIGTTLPIGNKNQGFEYQCTAACALAGASSVNTSLQNGTIKHVKLTLDEGESMWYLIAPTSLALTTSQQSTLKSDEQTVISGKLFLNSSSVDVSTLNAYIDLLYYGFDTTRNIANIADNGLIQANGKAYVDYMNQKGLTTRTSILEDCWSRTKTYFSIG